MFERASSRVAAHASDSASQGTSTSTPSRSPPPPAPAGSCSPGKAPGFHMRRKFHLHFLRFRLSAFLRLLKTVSASCRHALLRFMKWNQNKTTTAAAASASAAKKKTKKGASASPAPSCRPPRVGLTFSAQCTRSACAPDAIADCIEFIKRSASSSSSSSCASSSASSSCSSLSNFSSPPSSSAASPLASPRESASRLRHDLYHPRSPSPTRLS